jgi:hypothetical protein
MHHFDAGASNAPIFEKKSGPQLTTISIDICYHSVFSPKRNLRFDSEREFQSYGINDSDFDFGVQTVEPLRIRRFKIDSFFPVSRLLRNS